MTKGARTLGAELSHALRARGVDVIFGIPGVHNVELYRGIEEAGIRHVLARHEQGAGFMADGYARATGKPGVAYVITGPGLCNIMTPMGQAYSDSVPMLVISSCLDETSAKRGQLHQMLDQEAAAGCVCAWSHEARDAEAAFWLLDRAFNEFESVRKRPRHMQVPISLLSTQVERPASPPPVCAQEPDQPERYAEIADVINSAKRPLFIFGGGARGLSSAGIMGALLEKTGAASFVTYAGRGLVPAENPYTYGSTLARSGSKDVLARADLVVAVGTELAEVDLWRDDLGHAATLLRIDIDPEVLADRHRADIRVQADAERFLAGVLPMLSNRSGKSPWSASEVAAARGRWRLEADMARPGIVPICDALREALPAETMVYSDMTQFAYVAKEVWDMPAPGLWHHPTGFGTLGYALPAAIGGKVARQDLPVVAIAGDYGFHYTMQELGVAVELGLSLPIILWDNGKLKEIEDSMRAAQIAPNAVVARNPDFGKLAEAFGAAAVKPASLKALQAAVKQALQTSGPTLIHVTPEII